MKKISTTDRGLSLNTDDNKIYIIENDRKTNGVYMFDLEKLDDIDKLMSFLRTYGYTQDEIDDIVNQSQTGSTKNVRIQVVYPESKVFRSISSLCKNLNVSYYIVKKMMEQPENAPFGIKLIKI